VSGRLRIATWQNLVDWNLSDIRGVISKKKGCRKEIECPIAKGGVNLKIGGAISSRNVFFQK